MFVRTQKTKALLKNLLFGGLGTNDCDVETLRRVAILNSLVFLSLFILFPLSVIALKQHMFQLVFIEAVLTVFLISMLILLRITGNYFLSSIPTVLAAGIFYAYLVATGGKNNSGFIWAFTYPLITNFLLGNRKGTVFSLILFAFTAFVFTVGNQHFPFLTTYSFNLTLRVLPAYLLILVFSWAVEKTRITSQNYLNNSNLQLKRVATELDQNNRENENIILELKAAIKEANQLRTILPICSICKSIRKDDGYWDRVESYFKKHSGTNFSHGVCPECAKKHYADLLAEIDLEDEPQS